MKPVLLRNLCLTLALATVATLCLGAGSPRKPTSSTPPVVSPETAEAAGISAQELSEAGKLYTTKCMRCHKSYEPRAYDATQWESWMTKMTGKKAHLTPGQDKLLRRYLGAYRAETLVAKTNTPAPRTTNPTLGGTDSFQR